MPDTVDSSSLVPTPVQLRAVAHPIRIKLLGLLRLDGEHTATGLAERLGLNTGATSYHLRQLATHGFIEEVPDRGTGRERWLRAAHRSTLVTNATDEGASAFIQAAIVRQTQVLQAGAEEFDELPDEWKRASTHSDWTIRLSAADSKALVEHISDFLKERFEAAPAGPAEYLEQVTVQLHVFPRPGVVPPAEVSD